MSIILSPQHLLYGQCGLKSDRGLVGKANVVSIFFLLHHSYLLENVDPLLESRDIYYTHTNEMNVHEDIRNNLEVSSLWESG